MVLKPIPQIATPPENDLAFKLETECKAMFVYALKTGKNLDSRQIQSFEKQLSNPTNPSNLARLTESYNHLLEVVSPTSPRTILQLEAGEKSNRILHVLGPLPIIRQFMVIVILSLLGMISISLSPHVNVESIQLSMLQGAGSSQMLRLAFLVACASVGASFYALFKMNNFMAKGTFDTAFSHTYWSRFVLGIASGLLLSELFVALVEPQVSTPQETSIPGPMDSLSFLLKPVLAILGGFSANLVYRILNKLVTTVEMLFKGEAEEMIAQREFQAQLKAREQQGKIQAATANQLLQLKQSLVDHKVPDSVLSEVDNALAGMIGQPLSNQE